MKWTEIEINFLKENYSNQGVDYCLSKLKNRTKESILCKCTNLKLKLNEELRTKINKISRKKSTHYLVDYLQFINITKEEISYILGFIWADGFINFEPIKKGKTKFIIGVSINIKDSDDIYKIFQKTGNWKVYNRKIFDKRTKKYYKNTSIQTCNEYITNFLIENDYDKKSIVSPYKILSKIPDNLKSHFYRGFSDGDGCFYNNNRICQYILSGSYSQNWGWIEEVLNNFNITYNKSSQVSKRGKSSYIRFTNINDIIKFGGFIYDNWKDIGLKRKNDIYLKMKNLNIKPIKFWTEEEKEFLINNYKKHGSKYCSNKLNRSENSISKYFCLLKKNLNEKN